MKIIFVTSNKKKVETAKRYFQNMKVDFEAYAYDFIEPRTDDIQEIAKSKVMQAYKVVYRPCIAQDAGFFIEALNGFPKAYVNFALKTIGIEGILKLMQGENNRKCMFKECLAYYDGENIEYFYCEQHGTLTTDIRKNINKGEWSGLWSIFIPEFSKDGRASSEYLEKERNELKSESDESSFEMFAKWLKDNNACL